MKIKLIRLFAIILLIGGLARFFANLFLGVVNLKLFHHLFFDILWIITSIGLLKIQNWGRRLITYLSIYYILLFMFVLLISLIAGDVNGIASQHWRGFIFSIIYIVFFNSRHIKETFLDGR